ncbi:hypothetical protein ABIB51_002860, partial [Arthrobacter sp. UYCu712]
TPSGASKHKPPGWTSPSGRHYPSEHQDWEPPRWPHRLPTTYLTSDTGPHHAPGQGLPADPGHHPDPAPTRHPGQDPGRDPEPELPPDPFPDWHQFTDWHPLPAADPDDPGWPAPLDDPIPEWLLLLKALDNA